MSKEKLGITRDWNETGHTLILSSIPALLNLDTFEVEI